MANYLYVHLSWTTLDRLPMITEETARFLRDFLPAEATRRGAKTIALGIVQDHVHMLVEAPAVWDLPRLIMGLKGASSHEANKDEHISKVGLRWAKGYDARTVGPGQLRRVVEYVRNQAERHPERAIHETAS